jgi:hypothetical protein
MHYTSKKFTAQINIQLLALKSLWQMKVTICWDAVPCNPVKV